jgi:hypothetical protein
MAIYTSTQLYGVGTLGENLTQATTYTFAFTNPSASAYFTLETVRNPNGFYDTGSAQNTSGSWVVSSSMQNGFIQSPYIASVVVPPGNSSLTFTPAIDITGTNYYLRGTGAVGLTIS